MQTTHDRFAAVVRQLAPGAALRRHWPLEGGVSAHVDAFEITHPEGRVERLVLRRHAATEWKPLEADVTTTEFGLLAALTGAGFPVPAPRFLDTSGTILPTPYMVMDFVDGSAEVAPAMLPGALRRMARFLTSLHALDLGALDLPVLPPCVDPVENTMRYLPETSLGERIRAAHEAHGPIVATNPPALLHGDYWPGNVLWRDGEIAAVIDWEDTAIGDPVADLAGSRNELLWKYGRDAMETFTRHYLAETPINLANLPFWQLTGAVGALALMGEWGLDREVEADMRAKCWWTIERALETITGDA